MVGITRRRVARALAGLLCLPFHTISAHPIHMSYTEVRFATGGNSVEISVRVYANDFSAAAARSARVRLRSDSLIDVQSAMTYINQNLRIVDAAGNNRALGSCGISRARDMLRFCFKIAGPSTALRIRNTIMTELFADQVNVVQSVSPRGRTSRLFVRGDGWKSIE